MTITHLVALVAFAAAAVVAFLLGTATIDATTFAEHLPIALVAVGLTAEVLDPLI